MKTLVKLLFIFIPFIFIQCNKESIVNDQVEILNTPSAMCNLPDLGVQGINEGDFHNYLCNLIIDSLQICPEYPTEVSERIVEILIKNKGKILTRDMLLDKIWGYEYIGETRTVDVHIRYLRKKVEDDDKHPKFIETIRGVGYRFNPNC